MRARPRMPRGSGCRAGSCTTSAAGSGPALRRCSCSAADAAFAHTARAEKTACMATNGDKPTLTRKRFERELARLQRELVILQEYIKVKGLKVVVVFEG